MAELESASKETKAAGYMSHKEFCGKLNSSISIERADQYALICGGPGGGRTLTDMADPGFSRSCKKPKITHPHQAEQ